jgi:rare lipoprotein A
MVVRRIAVLSLLVLASCSLSRGPVQAPERPAPGQQVGQASWYGGKFHGRRTASGARFDQNKLTAASRTLPLGSRARVTNLHNGRSVVVQITDRGPYARRRVIDLSRAAAQQLGMVKRGTARVRVEPLVNEPVREASRSR